MKYLLFVLLFFGICSGYAQTTTYGNFKLVDQELFYQKVFHGDSLSAEKLVAFYQTLSHVKNVQSKSGEEVTFDVIDLVVDYKKFKFSQMATPSIIQTGRYSGAVTIQVKEDRYRVTFSSIKVKGDLGYKKLTEPDALTTYATRNSATIISQDWTKPNMLGLLDQAFTDNLQFVEAPKVNLKDDW